MSAAQPAEAGFDPERYAGRLAPAGAAVAVAGACAGGWLGWLLAAAGLGLVLLSCWSRTDGLLVVGPFVQFELVRAARTRRLALWRSLYALAAFALLLMVFAEGLFDPAYRRSGDYYTRQAEVFFLAFAGLQFCHLVYLTAQTVAPVVAEEREAKRWDFLLVTDLRAREILFGKLAGRVPMLLDPVLASLPVLALVTLFGGVSPRVVIAVAAGTVACVAGTAAVSLLYSVYSATAKAATDGAIGVVMLYLLGPAVLILFAQGPVVWTFPTSFGVPSPVEVGDLIRALNVGNPAGVAAFAAIDAQNGVDTFEPLFARGAARLAVFHLGVFLVFGLLASARLRTAVPFLGLKEPPKPDPAAAEGKVAKRASRPAVERPPVGEWPVYWWERYGQKKGNVLAEQLVTSVRPYVRRGLWAVGFFLAVRVIDPLHPWWAGDLVPLVRGLAAVGLVFLSAILMITPAVLAANSVAKERAADTLDGLRLTALDGRDILFEKWLGCLATAVPGNRSTVALCLAATVTGFAAPLSVVGIAVLTPVYAAALTAVGLFFSVRATTPAAAVRNFVLTVVPAAAVLLIAGVNLVPAAAGPAVTLAFPPLAVGTFFVLFGPFDGPPDAEVLQAAAGVPLGVLLYAGVGWAAWRAAVLRFDRDRHD